MVLSRGLFILCWVAAFIAALSVDRVFDFCVCVALAIIIWFIGEVIINEEEYVRKFGRGRH